jgi:Family of unknown function (DUF6526)
LEYNEWGDESGEVSRAFLLSLRFIKTKIMQEQNYKNHTRFVTGYHYVLFGIIFVSLICSLIHFYQKVASGEGILASSVLVLLTIALLLVTWFARVFALKAQDRAIRAEENFRHFVLTGKPLDSSLRIGQIVALRFAPDNEIVILAQKAVTENLSGKDIKAQIQNWKTDNYRV